MSFWTIIADGGVSKPPDAREIRRALELLTAPGSAHELRVLPSGRSRLIHADRLEEAVQTALSLCDERGLYYTLNPVRPDLGAEKSAKNDDIIGRQWLYVDVDPIKEKIDESSTDAEKEAARCVASTVVESLFGLGWPAPVLIDSGNGYHLLYRVDLPNDTESKHLSSAILKVLSKAYSTKGAKIDKAVHNAARIAKLPGTWSKKGTDTPERPYRMCRILSAPDPLEAVPVSCLQSLVGDDAPATSSPSVWIIQAVNERSPDRSAYIRAAVNQELSRVALAPAGDRNTSLNLASFSLGTLVGAGELDRGSIEAELEFAARRAGLGETEILATIRSGMESGIAKPRTLPEPTHRANGNGTARPSAAVLAQEAVQDSDVVTVCLSDVEAAPIEWLMKGRIPLGKLTLLAGLAKQGKSFLTMDLAARVSTGAEIPCGVGECMPLGSVVLLSAEDDLDDTIKPRLVKAGADTRKVHALTTVRMPDGTFGPFNLSYLPHLERAINRFSDTKLVIIDPVTHYIGSKIDDHKVTQLRSVLGPLKDLAAKLHIAILVVTHFSKGTSSNALHRVIGSSAYTALARANWILTRDPKDPKRRLFLDAGTNLCEEPTGLAFRIVDGRIEWEDSPVMMNADEMLQKEADEQKTQARKTPSKSVQQAAQWLTSIFNNTTELPSEDVFKLGEGNGFSRDVLYRARKEELTHIRAVKVGDIWVWKSENNSKVAKLRPY